jgi:hypothetical protein
MDGWPPVRRLEDYREAEAPSLAPRRDLAW